MRTLSIPSPRHDERGLVLVTMLFLSLTVLGLSVLLLSSTVAGMQQKRSLVATRRARQAAESGLAHAIGTFNGSGGDAFRASGVLEADLAGDGGYETVRYRVVLRSADADCIDNDFDDLTDEADETNMYEAVSVGYCDGVYQAVAGTFVQTGSAGPLSAVAFGNPASSLDLSGSTLAISGVDEDLDGDPTGAQVPGIGVDGDAAPLLGSIPSTYHANIVGQGGAPSVLTSAVDLLAYDPLQQARMGHDVRLDENGDPVGSAPPQPWGTAANPMVVYAMGDFVGDHVTFSEKTIAGAGVLVVDGSLGLDGSALDWTGVVIVQGRLLVDESTVELTGGLLVHGPSDLSRIYDSVATIQYSAEAIGASGALAPGWRILNWRAATPPDAVKDAMEGLDP